MNQNQKAIEYIIELLKAHGIKRVVISPGGTNMPLVKKIQDDPFFICYSVVDERSAIYFAIGLFLQTGEIIAASCTSAQATRNYIPGLTEAYYKKVPILALTMEKHPRFIGQDYMQAPYQMSLPEDCVKKSFEVPFISDIEDEYACIRIINEALGELSHNGMGPVQLCIPWLDFPHKNNTINCRIIKRYSSVESIPDLSDKKIMIVIGEHRPFTKSEIDAIECFSESHNCVIYTNHLSNYHGKYSLNLNLKFTVMEIDAFVEEFAPDILISIGGQTGDYPFFLLFSKPELAKMEHWRVSEDGRFMDTYDKLTKVFECDITHFFSSSAESTVSSHVYFNALKQLCVNTNLDVELPFSNAYVAQVLHNKIPSNSIIQFSILNSLRVWNLFDISSTIQCYSNVGAFGIDGGLSTLLGQSVVTDKLCFMIIGDLAFYYDMNALGIRSIKPNLRIIIINNNGGVEFKLYDGDYSKMNPFIAAAGHFKNAKGWAETCGFSYLCASNKEEFLNTYQPLLEPSCKPIVFELFVSDHDDYLGYRKLLNSNRDIKMTELLKNGIRKIIKR